ncbi:unnamed protein product [Cylicocyclus nassatus]|uniref:Uncharacterized protein n=1 Tax=Cylicocyclus nassatus TaxID=53992 RepID=A0AA36GY44_CYLNA|nr:unnamed protein product [Cylicocyclus nassatus]
MERRRAFDTHQDHTRPDRSRSPHQLHPWEKNCSETKSVLYSADVQFHRRSPNKQRSPSKQSSSKAYTKSKIPLKQSQPERARTTSHPQTRSDAGVQDYVEKLQKWSSMHSPSKFMAGMMSADGTYEVPLEATPKRRSRGPWFVEHYSKVEGPSQTGTEKSHGSKDNIIRVEKENRRTDEYLTSKLKDNEVIHSEKSVHSTTTKVVKSSSQVVTTDDDGYAIPTTEGRTGPMPSSQERETPIFATPSKVESPNELFYTPMTHPRANRTASGHAATPDPKLHDISTGQIPKFSLINVKKFSSTSPSKHDTLIKERTETQLASFEKASKRLDKALQEATEALQHPIKLTLPSDIPPFSDQRQTLDVAQVENLRNRDIAARETLRHSLPSKPLFENSLSYEPDATDSQEDSRKVHFASSSMEEKASEQLGSRNIPLSKVLGASMAAELAYAEKVQKIQTHLNNAHHLATLVQQKAEQQLGDDASDDVDRILDSISLRDDSLVTSDDSEKPKKNIKVQGTSKPMNTSVRFNFMPSPVRKTAFMTPAQRQERKTKVEEYLRMYNVLHTLQAAVFKLKRSKCKPEQVPKIEELSRVAEKEYREAIVQAKSWLRKRISQHEFLQIVERQQKKVYDESEECSNRIKRLLSAQAAAQVTTQDDASRSKNLAIPTIANENELPPVRMDTKALNESVECDLWNLSARSLRRNLDIRREQAEILNRSFEEKTRDIEQMTRKSITAQIIEYDRVISERTELLNKLDEISAEEEVSQPTPTPRRVGVEPLDLAQLEEHAIEDERNNISVSESGGNQQSSLSEDSTDVGIIRTISQSTVYEDSLSHFDEEEKNQSSASSSTLYQSDVDDALETKNIENADHLHPSRRTLDTAETLAMLSRQTVTVVGDENSLDSVDQILDKLESATFTLTDATIEEVPLEELSSSDGGKVLDKTFTVAPDTGAMLPNEAFEEADQFVDENGLGDNLITPHESVRLEVSMYNTGTWSKAEVNVPDKTVTHVSEVLDASTLETPSTIGNAVDVTETAESGDNNLSPLELSHEETKEVLKEGIFISDAEGSGDRFSASSGADHAQPSSVDEERPKSQNDVNEENFGDGAKEVTTDGENVVHEVEKETQLSSQSDATANMGLADEVSTTTESTATEEVLNADQSTSVVPEEENSAQRSSFTARTQDEDASLTEDFNENKAQSQEQEKLITEEVREVEPKSDEKREKDSYELSFLDVGGRVSMGLNRSELCDNLSTSILQSLLDSPRRRSLPRYTLNDSLLNDSVLATPKSPRAPKERFNTKMPGSSPRLLDDSLKSDIANIIVNDLVTNAVDDTDDLKELTGRLSFSSKEEQTVSKPVQNLFEQLDDTYEDLLSIEKPSSSLHTVLSPTDRTPGFPQLVADTPRKEPPPQPSAEDAKENQLAELSQVLESDDWMTAKCQQLVKPLWSRICAKGCILPLYDDFVAVPDVPEEISVEGEDEQLMIENKTFLIWATMIELASKLWPESQTEKMRLSSKMLPIPRSEEDFSKKATCYVLEQLSEMPASHRYNRVSRPPPPPYADTSVDKAVGRHVYQEDPYSFGREVDKEYRKLCEEIIEKVGDRFVSAEVQVLQHRLVASDIDTTPLTPSAMISGDYGRPSLSRLSVSSRVSIGSLPSKSPLRIVPEVSEL